METDHSKLASYINELPSFGIIANYQAARPMLYTLFTVESEPACMLITNYYIVGRKQISKEFLPDPADQAKWCKDNLQYFSEVASVLRKMRNDLVHNNFINSVFLIKLIRTLINFSKKVTQAADILNLLLDKLNSICETILNKEVIILDNKETNKISCPLCGSLIDSLNNGCNSKFNSENINSLKYWKENGYKEKLKGNIIKIINGKYEGKMAFFRSWAGTSAYVDIEELGRKVVRLDTLVCIMNV